MTELTSLKRLSEYNNAVHQDAVLGTGNHVANIFYDDLVSGVAQGDHISLVGNKERCVAGEASETIPSFRIVVNLKAVFRPFDVCHKPSGFILTKTTQHLFVREVQATSGKRGRMACCLGASALVVEPAWRIFRP